LIFLIILFPVCSGIELPNFYSNTQTVKLPIEEADEEKKRLEAETEGEKEELVKEKEKSENKVLISGFFFLVLSAGIDAYFQSQTYTFGLCGPLALTPAQVSTRFVTLYLYRTTTS
jgi:hypothetical protein